MMEPPRRSCKVLRTVSNDSFRVSVNSVLTSMRPLGRLSAACNTYTHTHLHKLSDALGAVFAQERLQRLHSLRRQQLVPIVVGHCGHGEEHFACAITTPQPAHTTSSLPQRHFLTFHLSVTLYNAVNKNHNLKLVLRTRPCKTQSSHCDSFFNRAHTDNSHSNCLH